ncbi:MAG: acyltransferase family protein, partial [Pseudomonadota bacterium]
MNYQPHIDGLRAIAVVSVLAYNIDKSYLPGGFVGVDIFFVISGYLISRLILKELELTGDFSFKNFYIRRVRRLFPVMAATFGLSFIAAYVLLSPQYLADFAESAIWAVLSLSNIYFWYSTNYFDSANTFKPLLHTWSLGIEEQFYLIWPLLMALCFAIGKRTSLIMVFLLFGYLSLVLNVLVFDNRVEISKLTEVENFTASFDVDTTAFYWLPFRVFEFVIGAILIFINWEKCSEPLKLTAFVVGLFLIVQSFLWLDDAVDFPGLNALWPCLGAALIIISGSSHKLALILTNRLMIVVGLISYSLYMVHKPIIVFYKTTLFRDFTHFDAAFIVLLAITLAAIFYHFVETPFRRPPNDPQKNNTHFLKGSAFAAMLLCGVGVHAIVHQGWASRYPEEIMMQLARQPQDYVALFADSEPYYSGPFAENGKPKTLVLGDSMAADLINAMVEGGSAEQLDLTALLVNHQCLGIFPLIKTEYRRLFNKRKDVCLEEHQRIFGQLAFIKSADTVILASYWRNNKATPHFASMAKYLRFHGVRNVMVLGQKIQAYDGVHLLGNYPLALLKSLRLDPDPDAIELNNTLQSIDEDFYYFDLLDQFCNQQG